MSRYIKIPIIIIILEIIAVIIGNVICFSAINNKADKNYLVQAKRIQNELESDPQASVLSQIDKNKYPDITDVRLFNDDDASSASYVVINAKGKQYRVEYAVKCHCII